MAPVAATYHLTTLLNLTLTLMPTLTTNTSKWFSAIKVLGMRTMKSKSRWAKMWVQDESWDVGSSQSRTSTCGSRVRRRWEKWRNLLKEFKKAKHQDRGRKKKKRKKEREAEKLRERSGEEEEKETRHKHNRSKFHHFFVFNYVFFFFFNNF